MDTWYGTMLIPEYGITILNTYDYGAFHGYFISWLLYFMVTIHALCLAYVVCSLDYNFLDIVSAELLSMIYMYLSFGKVGFCEMFAKRGTLQKSGSEVLREEIFGK